MKTILVLLLFTLNCFAKNYTYLLDEYTKEIELESKIVAKIAKDILKSKKVYLFIPNIKNLDITVYSKNVELVNSCEKANFIFVKYASSYTCAGANKSTYLLTNNYRQLLSNTNYLGAFFWSKSRPNIVLIKRRLEKNSINLPKEYNRYIEEL